MNELVAIHKETHGFIAFAYNHFINKNTKRGYTYIRYMGAYVPDFVEQHQRLMGVVAYFPEDCRDASLCRLRPDEGFFFFEK